jgi:hypothetical protein
MALGQALTPPPIYRPFKAWAIRPEPASPGGSERKTRRFGLSSTMKPCCTDPNHCAAQHQPRGVDTVPDQQEETQSGED